MGTSGPRSNAYSRVSIEYYGSRVDAVFGRSPDDVYMSGPIFAHYDGTEWDLIELPDRMPRVASIWSGPNGAVNCLGSTGMLQYDGREWTHVSAPVVFDPYWISDDGQVYATDFRRLVWRFDGSIWSELDSLPVSGGDDLSYRAMAGDSHDNVYAVAANGAIARFDGSQWSVVRPPDGRSFNSAWKVPSGPLYVTSWNDTMFAYDGTSLTPVDLGPSFFPRRVFGNAPAEVYVEGVYRGADCYSLRKRTAGGWSNLNCSEGHSYCAWGTSAGETFVGTSSQVLRIRGDQRDVLLGEKANVGEWYGEFRDMWGTTEDGVYAVGVRALRYFEGRWTDLRKEDLTLETAFSVWGTSKDDIWAVGRRMILHFDGDRWTWVSGANQEYMFAVWSDDREAIAVGSNGTIMRYDGEEWAAMPSGTTYGLRAVWGWDGGAFAAGDQGVLLRYNGTDWRIEDSPIDWQILDVFGLAPDNIWAVGTSAVEICHYNGREWTPEDIVPLQGDCVSVWASSNRSVFVANNNGIVLHFDGYEWSRLPRYTAVADCLWGGSNGDLLLGGLGIIRFQR